MKCRKGRAYIQALKSGSGERGRGQHSAKAVYICLWSAEAIAPVFRKANTGLAFMFLVINHL